MDTSTTDSQGMRKFAISEPRAMSEEPVFTSSFHANNWIILGQLAILTFVVAVLSQFSKKGIGYHESQGKLLFSAVLLGFVLLMIVAKRVTAIRIQASEGILIVERSRFFLRSTLRLDLATTTVGFVSRNGARGGKEQVLRIDSPGHRSDLRPYLSGWTTTALTEIESAVAQAQEQLTH